MFIAWRGGIKYRQREWHTTTTPSLHRLVRSTSTSSISAVQCAVCTTTQSTRLGITRSVSNPSYVSTFHLFPLIGSPHHPSHQLQTNLTDCLAAGLPPLLGRTVSVFFNADHQPLLSGRCLFLTIIHCMPLMFYNNEIN